MKAVFWERILYRVCVFLPLFYILGNILPTILGFRISFLVAALVVSLSIFILVLRKKIYFLFPLIFLSLMQLFLYGNANFSGALALFGPLLLLSVFPLNICVSKSQIKQIFVIGLLPLFIGLLQVVNLLPLTIGASEFVNYTKWDGGVVVRPNGYLYGVYELSVLSSIFLLSLCIYLKPKLVKLVLFFLLAGLALYFLRLRSVLMLWVLLFSYFYLKYYSRSLKYMNYIVLFIAIVSSAFIFSEFLLDLLQFSKLFSENERGQFMTGRVNIWIAIFEAFGQSDTSRLFFGFGSDYYKIFSISHSWKIDYIPGSHNTILELFSCFGLLGVLYAFWLIKVFLGRIDFSSKNKALVVAVFALYILTMGMTGPILSNLPFAVGFCFFIIITNQFHKNVN